MPKTQTPAITSNQARYILEKLLEEKTVTAADVRRHISGMWEEMSALEKRIANLRDLAEPFAHPVHAVKTIARKVRKRAKQVSAEVRASRRLQGQYISSIRQFPEKERAKYKKIASAEGREKAIAAMKKARSK
jgi:hypothetical protein